MVSEHPQLWKQNLKVSMTLFEMKDELRLTVDRVAERFKRDSGSLPAFHYYTFTNDDYERAMVTLSLFNERQRHLHVTALEEKIEDAIMKVKDINKHIKLTGLFLGYNADDFIYGRITARLEIYQPQQA